MHEPHEVQYWTKHLGIAREDLQRAGGQQCRNGQKAFSGLNISASLFAAAS
jgi:hypothetical protein